MTTHEQKSFNYVSKIAKNYDIKELFNHYFVIKYSKLLRLRMKERFVIIPVDREIRDIIKEAKGTMTYNQFFKKVVS